MLAHVLHYLKIANHNKDMHCWSVGWGNINVLTPHLAMTFKSPSQNTFS